MCNIQPNMWKYYKREIVTKYLIQKSFKVVVLSINAYEVTLTFRNITLNNHSKNGQ